MFDEIRYQPLQQKASKSRTAKAVETVPL